MEVGEAPVVEILPHETLPCLPSVAGHVADMAQQFVSLTL